MDTVSQTGKHLWKYGGAGMIENYSFPEDSVVLRNAHYLDVVEGVLRGPDDILVENGLILDMAPNISHERRKVIDCSGLTVSPGLIDCHCHILSPYITEQKGFPGFWAVAQMRLNAECALAAGIVCVRDMLSPFKVVSNFRRRCASGRIKGPDVLISGGIFSTHGGYPQALKPLPPKLAAILGQAKYEPQSPEEAATLARALISSGADHVKLGYTSRSRRYTDGVRTPVIADDIFLAVCAEARKAGRKTSVHHNFADDFNQLLKLRPDSLEHVVYDRDLTDGEISTLKRSGIVMVPTLTINDSQARFEEKIGFLKSDVSKNYLDPHAHEHLMYVCSTWTDFNGESYTESMGYPRANRSVYATIERNASRMVAAGIPMLAGTDFGAVVTWPGELIDELLRLEHVGMTRAAAIRAATSDAASFVGRNDIGSVTPGKKAYFTIIEGNPFDNLDDYRNVRYVSKGVRWYRPTQKRVPDFWPGRSVLFHDHTA